MKNGKKRENNIKIIACANFVVLLYSMALANEKR